VRGSLPSAHACTPHTHTRGPTPPSALHSAPAQVIGFVEADYIPRHHYMSVSFDAAWHSCSPVVLPACFLHRSLFPLSCAVSFACPTPGNCVHPTAALPPGVCCCFPQNHRCLVGSKDRQSSCVAIAALVRALERSGRVAILRWVQRDNMVSLGVGWGGVGWGGVESAFLAWAGCGAAQLQMLGT
jgi:hypothetical protein